VMMASSICVRSWRRSASIFKTSMPEGYRNPGAATIGYIQFNMLSDGIEEYMAPTQMSDRSGVLDLARAEEPDAGAGS
jgi:hypothetical protein